ncbi:MAG: hypothetical protein QHH43_03380 [Candidatus Saccharicenans sp.]|nr:hypothetical protein [Candidatus Saccharicenans sp.]MDH7574787.1 hypothetical protein [Candidatus Saccharicenans sp.]
MSTVAIIFLVLLSFSTGLPAREQGQFWQVTLRLQVQGDFRTGPATEKSGLYLLEAGCSGFLEEDGPDFIIYHLGSQLFRWEVRTADGQPFPGPILSPGLKLDYVEGKEEEINFYYSFDPEVIDCPADPAGHRIKLVLPDVPWSRVLEKMLWFKRKTISGQRTIELQRSQLTGKEIRKEFNWIEETSFQESSQLTVSQRSRVKIFLELTRCQQPPALRPGDGSGRRSVSAGPG